jgi:hypothetical protein
MEPRQASHPPRPLSGPTAARWAVRASNSLLAGFPFVVLLGLQTVIRAAWVPVVGLLGMLCVVIAWFWTRSKQQQTMMAEIDAGYSTLRSLGRRRRDLWYLHPDTLAVIRPPDGPPPSSAVPPAPTEDDEDDIWR